MVLRRDDRRLTVGTMRDSLVTLFVCGDVMLGRGIDQILPRPGNPALREARIRDAGDYVALAERAGRIPRPVPHSWPWGDSLAVLDEVAPDARIVNLETSITRSEDYAPGKAVHYRMSPDNLPCLATARPDACVLANNHVLDFGRRGLTETVDVLAGARMQPVGAGRNIEAARRPAIIPLDAGGRVLVFSLGTASSGVPASWAATPTDAGIDFIPTLSDTAADAVVGRVQHEKRPGDIVVASIHWGSNWGYDVADDQVRFAHRLIDGGVDVVHGHSSHHPRPVEVYRDKLVLYGCGDLINDYEGIGGREEFRSDLRPLYFATLEPATAALAHFRIVPMQVHRMQLRAASSADTEWLRDVLDQVSRHLGTRLGLEPDGAVILH
jgi:poly-gamma-glutamate capsule biosynthesis protein CapA/YwtB (metallophosphatase superfamily)